MVWQPIGAEAACPTNTGTATSFSSARFVRLQNIDAVGTEYLITLEQSDGTDIGSFKLDGQQSCIIFKDSSDQIFAANANILGVGVKVFPPHLHTV